MVRPVLIYLSMMVGVGIGIGLFMSWLNQPEVLARWWARGAYWDLLSTDSPGEKIILSIMYTTSLWGALLLTKALLFRYVPLHSWRGVVGHVLTIAVVSTVVFVLMKKVDYYICETFFDGRHAGEPPMAQTILITMIAVIVITSLTYAFDFYRRLRDAEQVVLQSELKALRAQINPHFLFNTLNSIAALVRSRPQEAERVTEQLADLFRYSLRASKQPTVTLRDELAATQHYVGIEQTRFGDRLLVQIDVPPEVLDAQVPSLLLQPLVENAVKHGVAQTDGLCAIRLTIQRTDAGEVALTVRDTGPGFDTTEVADVLRRGSGLANVRDRLYLRFGEAAALTILPDGVALRFPYRTATHAEAPARIALPRR